MAIQIRDRRPLFERPLRRSYDQRVLAGVCGGLAEWLGWEVTLVRLVAVGAAIVTSVVPIAIAYLILALVLPEERPRQSYLKWWEEVERY